MKKNFSSLIREEMVSRFDQVVKDEIRRSDLAIIEYKKALDNLKDQISYISSEGSCFKQDLFNIRDFVTSTIKSEVKELEKHCNSQIISMHRFVDRIGKSLESFKQEISKKVSKEELEDKFEILYEKISNTEKLVAKLGKSIREEMYLSFEKLLEITDKIEESLSIYIEKSDGYFISINRKIDENKIDATGVLRELQVYKKSMFIIEKKIENIYKKIENLEGTCHKPA